VFVKSTPGALDEDDEDVEDDVAADLAAEDREAEGPAALTICISEIDMSLLSYA
jgi:hypothetical protein